MSAAWAAPRRRWTKPSLVDTKLRAAKAGEAKRTQPSPRRTLSLALAAGFRVQGAPSR
jgi:hypothetical protein